MTLERGQLGIHHRGAEALRNRLFLRGLVALRSRRLCGSIFCFLFLVAGCSEQECRPVPESGFSRPTSAVFSTDGSRLYVISSNGDRRYCSAFISAFDLPDGIDSIAPSGPPTQLPGIPGQGRFVDVENRVVVAAAVEEAATSADDPSDPNRFGRLHVLGPGLDAVQELPAPAFPFWLSDSAPAAGRLLASFGLAARVMEYAVDGDSWAAATEIYLPDHLAATGRPIASANPPRPEDVRGIVLNGKTSLLVVDSSFYEFKPSESESFIRPMLWKIDPDSRESIPTGRLGDGPRGLAVDTLRGIAYVANLGSSRESGSISILDITTDMTAAVEMRAADFNPDLVDIQGRILDKDGALYELDLSPDGSNLLVTDLEEPRVYVLNLDVFHDAMRGSGATTLTLWLDLLSEAGDQPANYFGDPSVLAFDGKSATSIDLTADGSLMAVSDTVGNRVWIYSFDLGRGFLLR